jgi:hypothetical protein
VARTQEKDRERRRPGANPARRGFFTSYLAQSKVGQVTFRFFLNALMTKELGKPSNNGLPLARWPSDFLAQGGGRAR